MLTELLKAELSLRSYRLTMRDENGNTVVEVGDAETNSVIVTYPDGRVERRAFHKENHAT